jgi:hypothetical protein
MSRTPDEAISIRLKAGNWREIRTRRPDPTTSI